MRGGAGGPRKAARAHYQTVLRRQRLPKDYSSSVDFIGEVRSARARAREREHALEHVFPSPVSARGGSASPL